LHFYYISVTDTLYTVRGTWYGHVVRATGYMVPKFF